MSAEHYVNSGGLSGGLNTGESVDLSDGSGLHSVTVTTEATGVIPNTNGLSTDGTNGLVGTGSTVVHPPPYWETNPYHVANPINTAPVHRERPDTVKAVWSDPVQCPYGIPEEVCGSRVGEHSDLFRWSVHFPGFESYSVGDFVQLNSSDSSYSYVILLFIITVENILTSVIVGEFLKYWHYGDVILVEEIMLLYLDMKMHLLFFLMVILVSFF